MKREKSYYKSIFSLVCVFSYPVQIMEQWIKKKLSLLNVYVGRRYAPLILFRVSRKTERTQQNERNNSYIIAYKLHISENHSQRTHTHTHNLYLMRTRSATSNIHPYIESIRVALNSFLFVCQLIHLFITRALTLYADNIVFTVCISAMLMLMSFYAIAI